MTGSTVSGNSGTGIYNADLANITNSTVSGNTAVEGGGLSSCGTTNLYNSTISDNAAGSGGGIIIVGDITPIGCHGAVTASHTIIANSENGGDCLLEIIEGPWAASFTDGGHNIVEDGACIAAPTSHSGDPKLGPLVYNEGATLTHALLPNSPAIDARDTAACPATDQRGRPRPEDGDEDGVAVCDIRSYEARPVLEFTDLPSFTAAAGGYLNHITFHDLPPGTIVTDQYLEVGPLFVDGNDTVLSNPAFVTDGVGVAGHGRIHVQLTRPAVAIGADHPGGLIIDLYDEPGGTLLYTSSNFWGPGMGFISGVVTDFPFTYVVFRDWIDDLVYLDNIHIIKYEFKSFLPLVFQSASPAAVR